MSENRCLGGCNPWARCYYYRYYLTCRWGCATQDVGWLQPSRSLLQQQISDPSSYHWEGFRAERAELHTCGQLPYHGLSHEHPMDHLERFEDLISAIRVKGVSENYLFRYYLAGEALHWLKQLQPGSLKSWSEIKNAFLCNFFDEARAEDLRSKIATFTQEPT